MTTRRGILRLSKRQKLVFSTSLLTAGLLIGFLLGPHMQLQSVSLLAALALVLTLYCLHGDLTGAKWIIVILLPVLFTVACTLFYFLLPARWLTRIIMLLIYSVGFYGILLAFNIFVVSSVSRSIKLLHAARTIAFLFSVVCAFAFYNVLFSLHTYLPIVLLGVLGISFLLTVPIVWSVTLSNFLEKEQLRYIGILSLALTEVSGFLTFWPISATFAAIFLAGNFYTLVGVSAHWLEQRLFKRVLWEFIWVAIIIVVILFFTGKWGG